MKYELVKVNFWFEIIETIIFDEFLLFNQISATA